MNFGLLNYILNVGADNFELLYNKANKDSSTIFKRNALDFELYCVWETLTVKQFGKK